MNDTGTSFSDHPAAIALLIHDRVTYMLELTFETGITNKGVTGII